MGAISLTEDGRIVVVRMTGEISRESTAALLPETIEAARRLPPGQPALFLIDVRGGRNVGSSMSNYMFTHDDFSQYDILRTSRIAVVTDLIDTSHDFVQVTAENAGYCVRLFRLAEDAVDWLTSGLAPVGDA